VGTTSAFLLVTACSAQTASNEEKKDTPPVPLSNTNKVAPNPETDKSTPTATETPVAREGTADQPQPRPQPCEGMPADAVSPPVQEFLTCEVIQILAKPDRVQSFKVKPDPDESVAEDKRLGKYPIEASGEGAKLSAEQLKELQKLMFSEKSYIFDAEKRCKFRPEMGLHFVKGQKAVDVLFSYSCNLWLFVHKGSKDKLEDFDPVLKELVQLRKSLFFAGNIPTQN
jgi:hypothetical protein